MCTKAFLNEWRGACVLLMECILIAAAAGRSFIPLEIFCGRVGDIHTQDSNTHDIKYCTTLDTSATYQQRLAALLIFILSFHYCFYIDIRVRGCCCYFCVFIFLSDDDDDDGCWC